MKNTCRIISLLFVLLFSILTVASAETFDISDLSFAELVALKEKINLAIMQSDEWKEVTVPVGTYTVGTDIPAGDYTVTYEGRIQSCVYVYPNIHSVGSYNYPFYILNSVVMDSSSIGKLTLTDGQVIKIEYGSVVFRPYTGLDF